jgi:hypothetical protein
MNRNDWSKFQNDFSARFPSDWEWVQSKPKTLSLWYTDVFSGLALADCLDVSKSLFIGKLQRWEAYSRDSIPAVYQRHVGNMRAERRASAQEREQQQHIEFMRRTAAAGGIIENDKSMAHAFQTTQKMRADGATLTECEYWTAEYFEV